MEMMVFLNINSQISQLTVLVSKIQITKITLLDSGFNFPRVCAHSRNGFEKQSISPDLTSTNSTSAKNGTEPEKQ